MALSRGLVLWRKVSHKPMASIISRRFLLQTHKNSIRGILSVAANGSCLVTASARCKKGLSSWRPTHTSFYSSSTRVSSSGGGRESLKVKKGEGLIYLLGSSGLVRDMKVMTKMGFQRRNADHYV